MNNRWVTQTKFYDPSQPPEVCTGNCTEAALASLLGIRLEDVPSMQGLAASDYWDALEAFVRSRGYALSMHPPSHRPEGLYLADGPSTRGCGHFVVMRDGKMVHDPHPSRAGLLEVERVWSLMVLDPAAHLHPQPAELAEQQGDALAHALEVLRVVTGRAMQGSETRLAYETVSAALARQQSAGQVVGHVSRDSSKAHMCVNLPEGSPLYALTATGKQQVGEVQGCDELRMRTDGERSAYLEGIEEGKAQAARQPGAQEPFGYCADFDPVAHEFSHTFYYLAPGEKVPQGCTPFYAAPPAQGIDLGRLRQLSGSWLSQADRVKSASPSKAAAMWACAKELRDTLTLIDQRNVDHPNDLEDAK